MTWPSQAGLVTLRDYRYLLSCVDDDVLHSENFVLSSQMSMNVLEKGAAIMMLNVTLARTSMGATGVTVEMASQKHLMSLTSAKVRIVICRDASAHRWGTLHSQLIVAIKAPFKCSWFA